MSPHWWRFWLLASPDSSRPPAAYAGCTLPPGRPLPAWPLPASLTRRPDPGLADHRRLRPSRRPSPTRAHGTRRPPPTTGAIGHTPELRITDHGGQESAYGRPKQDQERPGLGRKGRRESSSLVSQCGRGLGPDQPRRHQPSLECLGAAIPARERASPKVLRLPAVPRRPRGQPLLPVLASSGWITGPRVHSTGCTP